MTTLAALVEGSVSAGSRRLPAMRHTRSVIAREQIAANRRNGERISSGSARSTRRTAAISIGGRFRSEADGPARLHPGRRLIRCQSAFEFLQFALEPHGPVGSFFHGLFRLMQVLHALLEFFQFRVQ